jgi:hypothetical protein
VYRSSGETETVTRIYTEILQAFAEVGGFKEIVFIGMFIIYSLYNQYYMDKYLREKLLPSNALLGLEDSFLSFNKHLNRPTRPKVVMKNRPGSMFKMSQSIATTRSETCKIIHCSNTVQETSETSRKKNIKRAKDIKTIRKQAQDHVDELTDVTTIVKELSSWQSFKEILLKDYQRCLMPIVEIKAANRRRETFLLRKKSETTSGGSNHKVSQKVKDELIEFMDIRTALDLLRASVDKNNGKPPVDWEEAMALKVDRYILENFPSFEGNQSNKDRDCETKNEDLSQLKKIDPNNVEHDPAEEPLGSVDQTKAKLGSSKKKSIFLSSVVPQKLMTRRSVECRYER